MLRDFWGNMRTNRCPSPTGKVCFRRSWNFVLFFAWKVHFFTFFRLMWTMYNQGNSISSTTCIGLTKNAIVWLYSSFRAVQQSGRGGKDANSHLFILCSLGSTALTFFYKKKHEFLHNLKRNSVRHHIPLRRLSRESKWRQLMNFAQYISIGWFIDSICTELRCLQAIFSWRHRNAL